MQRYVASRPMFMDLEVMKKDSYALEESYAAGDPSNSMDGLSKVYKDIIDTVQKESLTVMAVFPTPRVVMANLVQRVLEQRVVAVLDKLLPAPSLINPIPMEEGGYQQYLRKLAGAYVKTKELAKELHQLGCGDLDVEGMAESLFSSHKEDYPDVEHASLCQLFQDKVAELALASIQPNKSLFHSRPKSDSMLAQAGTQNSAIEDFVAWNEEAVARCILFTPQAAALAMNVRAAFVCLLDQVSQYTTECLERAMDSLNEAAQRRNLYSIGSTVSRRVAAAAATAAEAAAAAGERAMRGFMVAVHRATSNVAIVQQYFMNTIARLLLPVDGAHAACCEQMAAAMGNAEGAALKGLQMCIDTIMAEVERVLVAEQRATDFKPQESGHIPDHQPTHACTRVIFYMEQMLDAGYTTLEGFNKQAFLSELV